MVSSLLLKAAARSPFSAKGAGKAVGGGGMQETFHQRLKAATIARPAAGQVVMRGTQHADLCAQLSAYVVSLLLESR